jgi:hypothetical protein
VSGQTLVFLDLVSSDNEDSSQLRSVLESKLAQGRVAGVAVAAVGNNWWRILDARARGEPSESVC